MKNFYKVNFLSLAILFLGIHTQAQVEYVFLEQFGTPIMDINNSGNGVLGNGYFNFSDGSTTAAEEGVGQTVAINDNGQVFGFFDPEGDFTYVPALKTDGEWVVFDDEAFEDVNTGFYLWALSSNGRYACGQIYDNEAWSYAWPFIYDIQTNTLTIIDSERFSYGAAYGINDSGTATGWMDEPDSGGTFRKPATFSNDGTVTLINENYGEGYAISNSNYVVGYQDGLPFVYDLNTDSFQLFTVPDNYISGSFTDISELSVIANQLCVKK